MGYASSSWFWISILFIPVVSDLIPKKLFWLSNTPWSYDTLDFLTLDWFCSTLNIKYGPEILLILLSVELIPNKVPSLLTVRSVNMYDVAESNIWLPSQYISLGLELGKSLNLYILLSSAFWQYKLSLLSIAIAVTLDKSSEKVSKLTLISLITCSCQYNCNLSRFVSVAIYMYWSLVITILLMLLFAV